jgi:sigma-B regulation protein RsbU (phosphoserine phosphatase)
VLWISNVPAPRNLCEAAGERWDLAPFLRDKPLAGQLESVPLALCNLNGEAQDVPRLRSLMEELDATSAVSVFLLPPEARAAWGIIRRAGRKFLCVRNDASPAELAASLSAAAALQPVIRELQSQLAATISQNTGTKRVLEELDEEMRLAARLQRDFLPRRLPEVGAARFGVLYRPATWLSGDIYDVVRLDETHLGFYIADAVGHGMPAALLTMFVKKALQTKRIVGSAYEIVPPQVSLTELNTDIYQQNLSSCQFCTVAYCVLDTSDLSLTLARAGHPEPVLLRADGTSEALQCPGTLLGILPEETYEARRTELHPGDRLLIFSDGAEDLLAGPHIADRPFAEAMNRWRGIPRDEMLMQLTAEADLQHVPASKLDDITIVIMDVEKP